MQLPYSEELNTGYLARLFDNTSECYKLFWFKAIITKVFTGKTELSYEELIDQMIADAWYMVGHVFFNKEFSEKFREIMKKEYDRGETRLGYWEDVYLRYINELPPMKLHRYQPHDIEEFDSLDELRQFDEEYVNNTGCSIFHNIYSCQ